MRALRPKSPSGRGATAHAGSGSPGSGGSGSSGRGSPERLLRADSASSADQEWEPGSYGLVDAPQPKRSWGRPSRPVSRSLPALAAAASSASSATQCSRAVPTGGRVGTSSGSGSMRILARRAAPVPLPFGSSRRRSLDDSSAPASPRPGGSGFSPTTPVTAAERLEMPKTLSLDGAWLPGSPRVRSQHEAPALLCLDSPAADREEDSLTPHQRTDSAAFGRWAGCVLAGVVGLGRQAGRRLARLCAGACCSPQPSMTWVNLDLPSLRQICQTSAAQHSCTVLVYIKFGAGLTHPSHPPAFHTRSEFNAPL